MNNQPIENIEYIVPVPDKPIGSLSFSVQLPILHKDGQKVLADNDSADIILSKETLALVEQLGKSIIKDLEK